MIKSFKHKGLEKYFLKRVSIGLNPNQINKICNILTTLNAANNINDIKAYKSYKLHQLKGDLNDFWSVTVTANYRIIFKFDNGNVYDVDYVDYH